MGMTEKIYSHRDLKVWQKSLDLVDMVYAATEAWPKHELYGLTAQLRRAAVSIPSNIAEGNGRSSTADYLRFLDVSFGSLMEVDTQVEIARRRDYVSAVQQEQISTLVVEVGKMINGLRRSLRTRLAAKNSPSPHSP